MILLSTGSLHTYGLNRAFELAAESGYDGLEIIVDQRADTWQLDYLVRLSQQVSLPIRAVHSPFLLGVPGWPADDGERITRTVKLAENLGARIVVVHLPTRWPYAVLYTARRRLLIPFVWRRNSKTVKWFQQVLPFVQAETSATIAVEIMPMHRLVGWPINAHVWNSLAEWAQFDHLTLDTTHCATWRVDPRKAFDRAQGRVSHIHISNYDGREHRLPQQGKLKLDKFLQHVAAAEYQGDIAVETGPEAMETDDMAKVGANLKAALAFCREHLRH